MSLSKTCLTLPLHSKLDDIEKLLKIYTLAKSLSRPFGFAYIRKNFILRALSRTRGLIPLYKEVNIDQRLVSFLESYITLDFMDMLFHLLKAVSDIEVRVNNRVHIIIMDHEKSVTLEEEPRNYLVKVIIVFPRLFRKGHITIFSEKTLFPCVLKIIKSVLSEHQTLDSYKECRPWSELSKRQVEFLMRSLRNYSLEEIFLVIFSLRPSKNEFELRAGLDVFKYGHDLVEEILEVTNRFRKRARSERLRNAIVRFESEIKKYRSRLWFADLDKDLMVKILDCIRRLSEWARVDKEELKSMLPIPSRRITIRLWKRSLDDLFMGFYAGTCIALDERKVMHEYIFDPYTLFFRIYVNTRPIGHIKVFICKDEDSEVVLHIDYIGLSRGKYERLHNDLKLYSLSAIVKYAMLKNYRRVYVAKDVIPILQAKLVRNSLVKLGKQVYSQYLDKDKFLIWDALPNINSFRNV
ncbi:MAG: hypothetical protein DRN53_00940 [Thermoprotei archaeon]|nr:MAG: hypothetical protein DRN53_00940 [Thermoprotei archaeon]